MEIVRFGSQRDHGPTVLMARRTLKSGRAYGWGNNVHWDRESKQILIKAPYVAHHQNSSTHHDYEIRLSIEDIPALVAELGHAASIGDSSLFQEHLGEQIHALVKILAGATGTVA